MICNFQYENKQKKYLIETDYTEDIYDVIEDFFESKGHRPHVLIPTYELGVLMIRFGRGNEGFVIEDINKESADEVVSFLKEGI